MQQCQILLLLHFLLVGSSIKLWNVFLYFLFSFFEFGEGGARRLKIKSRKTNKLHTSLLAVCFLCVIIFVFCCICSLFASYCWGFNLSRAPRGPFTRLGCKCMQETLTNQRKTFERRTRLAASIVELNTSLLKEAAALRDDVWSHFCWLPTALRFRDSCGSHSMIYMMLLDSLVPVWARKSSFYRRFLEDDKPPPRVNRMFEFVLSW